MENVETIIILLKSLFLLRKERNKRSEWFVDCQTLVQNSVPNELMLIHPMEGKPVSDVTNLKMKGEIAIQDLL